MIELTLKELTGGSQALYMGRARVGYVDDRGGRAMADARYRWSLNFMSEALRHCPTGATATLEEGRQAATRAFRAWCAAAGLEEKNRATTPEDTDDRPVQRSSRVGDDGPSAGKSGAADADRASADDKPRKRAGPARKRAGAAKAPARERKV